LLSTLYSIIHFIAYLFYFIYREVDFIYKEISCYPIYNIRRRRKSTLLFSFSMTCFIIFVVWVLQCSLTHTYFPYLCTILYVFLPIGKRQKSTINFLYIVCVCVDVGRTSNIYCRCTCCRCVYICIVSSGTSQIPVSIHIFDVLKLFKCVMSCQSNLFCVATKHKKTNRTLPKLHKTIHIHHIPK